MATITKRGNTYRIRTSCGYDVHGKQVTRSMTYKPQEGMSEKQIEKEVNKQAVLFEEQWKKGTLQTSMKFEAFARQWFKDYAEISLKKHTIANYHRMEKRLYKALGHIRIDRITKLDIQRYIRTLVGEGLKGVTVKNHVRMASGIFRYAISKNLIESNPCSMADYPQMTEPERNFYSVEEVRDMLKLLEREDEENLTFAVFMVLAIYTGCRKGELLGLEWKDIDWENGIISINRAYYYSTWEKIYYTDTPKSSTSKRSLKIPEYAIKWLKKLKAYQAQRQWIARELWQENDRLFTAWNGETIKTGQPLDWLHKFCDEHDMRRVNLRSFRHFNASALINGGVDVVTVQHALGHSKATTTLNTYSHAFNMVQVRAMEAVAQAINL